MRISVIALTLVALFTSLVTFADTSAVAHEATSGQRAQGATQLFVYDPTRSGTVAVAYVNKFNRLAALLVQPHSAVNTACGYSFGGLVGLRLAGFTLGIDLSNDTSVTGFAVWVLIGRNGKTLVEHTLLGQDAASVVASGPGWTSYRYNASQFQPPIGANEVLSSLSLSLLGGEGPSTHEDHWASRPVVNGVQQHEILNHQLNLSRTDGYIVLP